MRAHAASGSAARPRFEGDGMSERGTQPCASMGCASSTAAISLLASGPISPARRSNQARVHRDRAPACSGGMWAGSVECWPPRPRGRGRSATVPPPSSTAAVEAPRRTSTVPPTGRCGTEQRMRSHCTRWSGGTLRRRHSHHPKGASGSGFRAARSSPENASSRQPSRREKGLAFSASTSLRTSALSSSGLVKRSPASGASAHVSHGSTAFSADALSPGFRTRAGTTAQP